MIATDYAGPLVVTLLYVAVYYGFILNVLRVRSVLFRAYGERGEKFDRYFNQDRQMLAADRIQLNTLEHMGPFLALLWLNAVFVDVGMATWVGGFYVAARALYPLALGARLGRGVPMKVLLSTAPGYGVILFFAGALVWKLITG